MSKKLQDCLIIGSGISGLMAAGKLTGNGIKATVLDKGRGTGGRIATRRLTADNSKEAVVDYGAQFFTVKNAALKSYLTDWLKNDVVRVWHRDRNHTARYIGNSGMRDLTRHLGKNLTVYQQKKVTRIRCDGKWYVETDDGNLFQADSLILTPPVPQSLELLQNTRIRLDKKIESELRNVSYHHCIALMGIPDGPVHIPFPGYLESDAEPVSWIADNRQKGISPEIPSVTVHTGPEFSKNYWSLSEIEIAERLLKSLRKWMSGEWQAIKIHRWRYSKPVTFFPEPCLLIKKPAPLVLAGDGFTGARVESAALSGLAAAERLMTLQM